MGPPAETDRVEADRGAIEDVVSNLLSNAIKYTKSGGSVTVTTRQSGDRVEVQVTDTGIGIPAEDLKDLFTEFYRAANAQEMEKEGSGLGLSIAKEIITRYGGSISVQSEVDKGSTFTFGLPLAQEHRTE
jgi:two-component system sensor histidine kinase VicK